MYSSAILFMFYAVLQILLGLYYFKFLNNLFYPRKSSHKYSLNNSDYLVNSQRLVLTKHLIFVYFFVSFLNKYFRVNTQKTFANTVEQVAAFFKILDHENSYRTIIEEQKQ